jgi:hypothetical protein
MSVEVEGSFDGAEEASGVVLDAWVGSVATGAGSGSAGASATGGAGVGSATGAAGAGSGVETSAFTSPTTLL